MKTIGYEGFFDNLDNCVVYKEKYKIDLYITDGNKHIIIENKLYAGDGKKQIESYIEKILENKQYGSEDVLMIYLSINRDCPSKDSLGNMKISDDKVLKDNKEIALFKSINYKKEMLEWLKNCQMEIRNITNLNEVFRQYIDVIHQIYNNSKDNVMSIKDFINENEDRYNIAGEFFKNVKDNLKLKLKLISEDWVVEIHGNLKTKHRFPFRIYKQSWKEAGEHILFAFEFKKNDYVEGFFAIFRYTDAVNFEEIKKELDNDLLNKISKKGKWSLIQSTFGPTLGEGNFIKSLIFNDGKRIEGEFVKQFMEMITTYEVDSWLLTKMNECLQKKECHEK